MGKLLNLEKLSQEEVGKIQADVSNDWEPAITDLKMNGLDIEEYDTLVFVTHDSVIVYDKVGTILDMWWIRYPFEIEKRKEKKS